MVTGDNVETAKSIAEKCGIIPKGNKGLLVLDGPTFRKKVMTVTEDGKEVVSCACTCTVCLQCTLV